MANIKSAEKRNRQRIKRRARNLNHLTAMRTKVKRARTTLSDTKADIAQVGESIAVAVSQLARAASKGVIHKKTAARKISRLTLALNKTAKDRTAPSSATPKKQPKKIITKAAAAKAEAKAAAEKPAVKAKAVKAEAPAATEKTAKTTKASAKKA